MEIDPLLAEALTPCLTDPRGGERPPARVWLAIGAAFPPDERPMAGWARVDHVRGGQRWSIVVVAESAVVRATATAGRTGSGRRPEGIYVVDEMTVDVQPLRRVTGYRVEAVAPTSGEGLAGRARYVFDVDDAEALVVDGTVETDPRRLEQKERAAAHLIRAAVRAR